MQKDIFIDSSLNNMNSSTINIKGRNQLRETSILNQKCTVRAANGDPSKAERTSSLFKKAL